MYDTIGVFLPAGLDQGWISDTKFTELERLGANLLEEDCANHRHAIIHISGKNQSEAQMR